MAEITTYTIYFNTSDYPNRYVVREFIVNSHSFKPVPKDVIYIGTSLEEARRFIPMGLVMIPRAETDEKQIVESWI